jgi:hypothetical protein
MVGDGAGQTSQEQNRPNAGRGLVSTAILGLSRARTSRSSGCTQETAAVGPLTEVGPTRNACGEFFFSMTPSGRAAGTGN